MAYYDDLNNTKIVTIGVWGSLITFVTVLLLQAAYYQGLYINNENKASEFSNTVEFLEEQQKQLEGYQWIDQEKGIIGIPIEKAMEKVVKEAEKATASETAA